MQLRNGFGLIILQQGCTDGKKYGETDFHRRFLRLDEHFAARSIAYHVKSISSKKMVLFGHLRDL
jgi:hypothetical protein